MKSLFQFIIGVAVCIAVALLLKINPEQTYGWYMGIVHGCLLVPNWIINIFDDSWLIKAADYTSMYNVTWWVCGILDILYWIWAVIGLILSLVRFRR